jgi:hypothetical protein
MAGIIVEYARFVEVQQRRARHVPQRVRWQPERSAETDESAAVDDQPLDLGESRRQYVSGQDEAAHDRDSTTRGSLDG